MGVKNRGKEMKSNQKLKKWPPSGKNLQLSESYFDSFQSADQPLVMGCLRLRICEKKGEREKLSDPDLAISRRRWST